MTEAGTSYLTNGKEIIATDLPFSSIIRAQTYTPYRFTAVFGENLEKDKKLFVLIHDSNAFLEANLKYMAYEELDSKIEFIDMSFNESKETMELWYRDTKKEIKMKQIFVNQKRVTVSSKEVDSEDGNSIKASLGSKLIDESTKIDLELSP